MFLSFSSFHNNNHLNALAVISQLAYTCSRSLSALFLTWNIHHDHTYMYINTISNADSAHSSYSHHCNRVYISQKYTLYKHTHSVPFNTTNLRSWWNQFNEFTRTTFQVKIWETAWSSVYDSQFGIPPWIWFFSFSFIANLHKLIAFFWRKTMLRYLQID